MINKERDVAITETIPSITHVAVTVTDLDRSEAWYTKVLGVAPVLDEDTGPFRHIVYSVGSTLLGLHGFPELVSDASRSTSAGPASTTSRSACANRDELVEWAARLDELGIAHGGDQGRRLRLGSLVPRSRQHRPRALRSAGVTQRSRCGGSTGMLSPARAHRFSRRSSGLAAAGGVEGLTGPPELLGRATWSWRQAVSGSPLAAATAACASAIAASHEVPCHSRADRSAASR